MTPKSAVAFVLQASPWAPLVVRRGSSAEVSVRIELDDDERDTQACLVWQFFVEDHDIGFQILKDAEPIDELTRVAATDSVAEEADEEDTRRSLSSVPEEDEDRANKEGIVTDAAIGSIYTFRWVNSYSLVRHKKVQYRFLVTSQGALTAAHRAARDSERRYQRRGSISEDGSIVKPHLAKRLELERRLTVDEVTMEQTRTIEQLQRCVSDMVSMFMMDPDRPLHEGSCREFITSLEAVLRNGIKESYLEMWPEEPYFEFLLQIEVVLRDDKGIVDEANALVIPERLMYLGWTRSRALLFAALNKNFLHYAFENLIKRRAAVERFYDRHALIYMYSSAHQIASYMSALNGVKFMLALYPDNPDSTGAERWPPNLFQCAPNTIYEGNDAINVNSELADGRGFLHRSENEDPDTLKQIRFCSVPRFLLTQHPIQEIYVGRSEEATHKFEVTSGHIYAVAQLRVHGQDVIVALTDQNQQHLIEPITIEATDQWVDVLILLSQVSSKEAHLKFDNSSSMVRGKQVSYRLSTITEDQFDSAWESCHNVAQSISWKIATSNGMSRCENYMESVRVQEHEQVSLQRSREGSGVNEGAGGEESGIFGRGASLISKPVSYLVGGLLSTDEANAACSQCLTPFSFFSRQIVCPSCQVVVCIPCSRHYTQLLGKGPQVKVCDRCFIKEKDQERKRRMEAAGDGTDKECTEYTALRKDPSMDKYFKMLSFGVPPSGVAQKMLQDDMPTEKINIFAAGPLGPTENDGSASHGQMNRKITGLVGRQGNSLRKVHWTSLQSQQVNQTIWTRSTARRKTAPIHLSPNDYQEIEALFGESSKSKMNDKSGDSKKRVFSALDSRRSNNISIGLSQFKHVGGSKTIIESLKSCNFDFLTSDRLSTIYEIAPTSVETKRYTNFRVSRSKLEPAELFLVEMSDIPRVAEKVAAMMFVSQFESQVIELRSRIRSITEACCQVLQSERLARCFELILAIGNMLNAGTDMEGARGVTLGSLLKLSVTKSVDRSVTLLQFIVKLIHDRGEGDLLYFLSELSAISNAKRFSNVICLSQAKALLTGLKQVEAEVKEEMILDKKLFENEEAKRRQRYEAKLDQQHQSSVSKLNVKDASSDLVDPRNALMNALRARDPPGKQVLRSDVEKPQSKAGANASARSALLSAIQNKATQLGADMNNNLGSRTFEKESSEPPSPRVSTPVANGASQHHTLMAAIRQRNQNQDQPSTAHNYDQRAGSQTDLIAAIRSKRSPVHSSMKKTLDLDGQEANKSPSSYVPHVYLMENNRFITEMRKRILAIKSTMEELELEVETMNTEWDAAARYLGEDPISSSSEYVLNLLNRFILDVKVAKTLLFRKGITFSTASLLPNVEVGSVVATTLGPGVITALRIPESKIEIKFQWSREAYVSPVSVLTKGALVRCRRLGVGIIRETHYDRGMCNVRFSFGYGIVRVEVLTPETSSAKDALRKGILDTPLCIGDPVVTTFGYGYVQSIRQRAPSLTSGDTIVAVQMASADSDGDSGEYGVAYVHSAGIRIQY